MLCMAALGRAPVPCRAPLPQRRRPALARPRPLTVCFVGQQADAPEGSAASLEVSFKLQRHVAFGEQLLVVGSHEALGAWELGRGLVMTWHEGDVWEARASLPAGATCEYKFVLAGLNGAAEWESCANRTLALGGAPLDLDAVWCAPLATSYHERAASPEPADDGGLTEEDVPPPFRPAEALKGFTEAVQQSLDTIATAAAGAAATAATASADLAGAEVDSDEVAPAAQAPPQDALAAQLAAEVLATADAPPAAAAAADAPQAGDKGGKPKPTGASVQLPPEAEAAVDEAIWAAAAAADGGAPPPAPAPGDDAPKSGGSLKGLGTVAGTVALGVAAAGLASALAVDLTDVALLGGIAAAGAAAFSTPAAPTRGSRAGSVDEEEGEGLERVEAGAQGAPLPSIATKPSAPGVILAAGALVALDAGKKLLADRQEGKAAGAADAADAPAAADAIIADAVVAAAAPAVKEAPTKEVPAKEAVIEVLPTAAAAAAAAEPAALKPAAAEAAAAAEAKTAVVKATAGAAEAAAEPTGKPAKVKAAAAALKAKAAAIKAKPAAAKAEAEAEADVAAEVEAEAENAAAKPAPKAGKPADRKGVFGFSAGRRWSRSSADME